MNIQFGSFTPGLTERKARKLLAKTTEPAIISRRYRGDLAEDRKHQYRVTSGENLVSMAQDYGIFYGLLTPDRLKSVLQRSVVFHEANDSFARGFEMPEWKPFG